MSDDDHDLLKIKKIEEKKGATFIVYLGSSLQVRDHM